LRKLPPVSFAGLVLGPMDAELLFPSHAVKRFAVVRSASPSGFVVLLRSYAG